jgi:hypothetical protein
MDQKSFGNLEGDGQVDLMVDSLHLLPGCYVASAGILDAHGIETLDVHHRAYPFSIASDARDLGLVHLDRRWHHRQLGTAHATSQPARATSPRLTESAGALAAKAEVAQ